MREITFFKRNIELKALVIPAVLLAIMFLGFWLKFLPYNPTYLADIDTHYLVRQAHYVYTHDFHLYEYDPLRYYPTSINVRAEPPGTLFIPSILFWLVSKITFTDLTNIETFTQWAKIFPVIMGALFAIPAYFIGRELKDTKAGLYSALFTVTSLATFYRTSAGVFEKENLAGLFILTSIYYLIVSYKRNSLLAGLVGGAAFYLGWSAWGGATQLMFTVAGVLGLFALLVKNRTEQLLKSIGSLLLFSVLYSILQSSLFPLQIGAILIIGIILAEKVLLKQAKVSETVKQNFVAITYAAGAALLLIGSFFSEKAASIVSQLYNMLFFKHGVIGSTVAEQAPGTWAAFTGQLSVQASAAKATAFVANILGSGIGEFITLLISLVIKTVLFFANVWVLAFVGICVLFYKSYNAENEGMHRLASIAMVAVNLFAFRMMLLTASTFYQATFLVTAAVIIGMLLRRDFGVGLLAGLLYTAMLSYAPFIRLSFLVGLYAPLFAGYTASWITDLALVHEKKIKTTVKGVRVAPIVLLVLLAVVVTSVIHPAYLAGKQTGVAYNANWEQSMQFMRENTPEDSVILSWWDYGYWFQLHGQRASNLDGGNNFGLRNIPTAQYFTGMMNESQQKYYLQKMGTTHVLVDASMVYKYAAMSKIANQGRKIDSYSIFYREPTQTKELKNGVAVVYDEDPRPGYGSYRIIIPVREDGSLLAAPQLVTPTGSGYFTKICNGPKIMEVSAPNTTKVAPECLIVSAETLIIVPEDIYYSVFHRLFFLNGDGIDYLTKVYENSEVKIYEIDRSQIPEESLEDLRHWWGENTFEDLMIDDYIPD